jgi:uncharacterized protein YbdZ (MbtH family)
MDSTILASKCYNFIYSPDSSKFLAFFAGSGPTGSHSNKFGGATNFKNNYQSKLPEFNGYMLWGMKHEGAWYFDKGTTLVFNDSNLTQAKDDFLFYSLQRQNFFENFLSDDYQFWERGGPGVQFLPLRAENYLSVYGKCYEGLPVIVASGKKAHRWVSKDACNQWFESNIERIKGQDSLFFNNDFPHRFHKNHFDLISVDQDKVMLSFYHKDKDDMLWMSFLYVQLNNDTVEQVFLWKKSISFPNGWEMSVLLPFYRQCIPEWNYANEVICDDSFWEKYVELVEDGTYTFLTKL